MTFSAPGVLTAVIGQIEEALSEVRVGKPGPSALLRAHATRADQLASITESVLAAEIERGGDPTTLQRLTEVATGLGVQCGHLDELAHEIERGDSG